MGLADDDYVKSLRNENAKDLNDSQLAYSRIANQRLANVASGNNEVMGFNPWLAMKQFAIEHTSLGPNEEAMYSPEKAAALSSSRDSNWDSAMKNAEAIAAHGGKSRPKYFTP
jgi:hypothetical protein